mmetsp:Transcript_71649/g.158454  ORF Transcript_71649/g.158454 Transcript_71649/m.158454 type:complete len:248 (-) Transcript_71649:403-1146(-)
MPCTRRPPQIGVVGIDACTSTLASAAMMCGLWLHETMASEAPVRLVLELSAEPPPAPTLRGIIPEVAWPASADAEAAVTAMPLTAASDLSLAAAVAVGADVDATPAARLSPAAGESPPSAPHPSQPPSGSVGQCSRRALSNTNASSGQAHSQSARNARRRSPRPGPRNEPPNLRASAAPTIASPDGALPTGEPSPLRLSNSRIPSVSSRRSLALSNRTLANATSTRDWRPSQTMRSQMRAAEANSSG